MNKSNRLLIKSETSPLIIKYWMDSSIENIYYRKQKTVLLSIFQKH